MLPSGLSANDIKILSHGNCKSNSDQRMDTRRLGTCSTGTGGRSIHSSKWRPAHAPISTNFTHRIRVPPRLGS